MLPPEQKAAFEAFHDAVRDPRRLDRRTAALVALAAALAVGCEHGVEHYLGVARDEGIDDYEIGNVQGIVMAVSAGKVKGMTRRARMRVPPDESA